MRRNLIVVASIAAAAGLAACSGAGSGAGSPLEEALSMEGASDGAYIMNFTDVRGIQESVGAEPADLTQPLDASDWDDADRWAVGAVNLGLPMGPDGRVSAVASTDVEWGFNGMAVRLVKAPQETVDATRQHLEGKGMEDGVGFDDGFDDGFIIFQNPGENWQSDVQEPALDDPQVQALLPCLEGAHIVSIATTGGGSSELFEHSFATAARVDDGAQGHAWSCVHVPDGAQEYADSLVNDNITEVTVEGDVVRVALALESSDMPIPPEAHHGLSAGQTLDPGF